MIKFSYILFIFIFISCNSLLIFWIMIEINLCFILVLSCLTRDDFNVSKLDHCLYYLLFQNIGRFIFLVSLILNESFTGFSKVLFVISLLIKMGLWPFHSWFYTFTLNSCYYIFFVMLTVQKVPIFFIFTLRDREVLIVLTIINIIVGLIYLFSSRNLIFGLISSSIYSVFWIFLLLYNSQILYFYFFILYSVGLYFMLTNYKSWTNKIVIISAVLFLISLPPFGIFFIKLISLNFLLASLDLMALLLIWVMSFASLVAYTKIFYYYFLENSFVFKGANGRDNSTLVIAFFFIFSSILLGF